MPLILVSFHAVSVFLGTLKLRDMESAEKAKYGKPLTAKYWDFAHFIRYAFHLSRFQSVPHRHATSMCIFLLKLAADQDEYTDPVEAAFSLRLHA